MIDDDPIGRVLYVDLTRRRFWVKDRTELFEKYIGGAGVAIQLLHEECPAGVDPYSPDNPIIFAVGQLNGLYPIASKMVAMFKSPHTGNLGESYAGGRGAIALRMAGYGAVVIKGKSESPVYLAVHGDEVNIRDASILWGMGSSYTVGRVIRMREPHPGIRTIMRIGQAGEKLVSWAGLISETYRHFGRLGLGAVFGSKKLKAITISGRNAFKFKDPKLYRQTYNEIFDALTKSPKMKKYHELGTSMNIAPLNEKRSLPTRNLQKTQFHLAEEISGEAFAQTHLGRRVACAHCPVSCIHIAYTREPYEQEPYFYKTKMISYDYELIYALGSMLEVGNIDGLLQLIDEVEIQGLDAMSAGVILAWATEMQEKDMISTKETGGLNLKWGDYETYIQAVRLIVEQPNDFYKALCRGVDYASSKYGGSEFALAFGGNEMPGYHTGPAAPISHLVSSRHSHLDSAGYSLDEKMNASGEKATPGGIAESLFTEEKWRQILSSLITCYFARGIFTEDIVVKTLKTVGYQFTSEGLMELGGEILKAKYNFKKREGFSFSKLRIPKRIFETPTPAGKLSENFIRESIGLFQDKIEAL